MPAVDAIHSVWSSHPLALPHLLYPNCSLPLALSFLFLSLVLSSSCSLPRSLALLLSPSVGSADLDTVARQGGGLLPEWVDEGWVLGAPSFKAPIEDLIYGTIY